ncbi:MAG: hypothetical protein ACK559_03590, partial [bacterium]
MQASSAAGNAAIYATALANAADAAMLETSFMGNDLFYFDQQLTDTGIDSILDFAPGSDRLVLSANIYTALTGSEITVNQFESIAGSASAN